MSNDQRTEPHNSEVVTRLVASQRDFLRFLERRLGDRTLAEDVLQEAFVRGIQHANDIHEDSAMAWFYRALRHAVIDIYRRRGASKRNLERFAAELGTTLPDHTVAPDAELEAAVCACVGEVAGTLKSEYATALRRIEMDGVPVREYAREAGISESNAGVRVFRARQALRKGLEVACGPCCSKHGCSDCRCEAGSAV